MRSWHTSLYDLTLRIPIMHTVNTTTYSFDLFSFSETFPRPQVSVLRGDAFHWVHTVQVGGRQVAVYRFQPAGPSNAEARVPHRPAKPVPELPQTGHQV